MCVCAYVCACVCVGKDGDKVAKGQSVSTVFESEFANKIGQSAQVEKTWKQSIDFNTAGNVLFWSVTLNTICLSLLSSPGRLTHKKICRPSRVRCP